MLFFCPWNPFPAFLVLPGSSFPSMASWVMSQPWKPTPTPTPITTITWSLLWRRQAMGVFVGRSCFLSHIAWKWDISCLYCNHILHQHLIVFLQLLHAFAWDIWSNLLPLLFALLIPHPMHCNGIFKGFFFFFAPSWHAVCWRWLMGSIHLFEKAKK